jgi:hypothetical protein
MDFIKELLVFLKLRKKLFIFYKENYNFNFNMQREPFDLRDGTIFYNGNFVEWKDAKVHILNHGLHYASSVFEGVRMYNGKIFKNTQICLYLNRK